MKKYLLTIFILAGLQLILLFGVSALVISLRSDCSFVSGGFAEWQCSGNANPEVIPIVAFVALPPILCKLLLDKFKQNISWKKVIALHAVTAFIVWTVLVTMSQPKCGCGG